MTTTKLKLGVLGAVIVAGIATPVLMMHQAQVGLMAKDEIFRQQREQSSQLTAENAQLSNSVVKIRSRVPDDQMHELLKLRGEWGILRSEAEGLRDENRLLREKMVALSNNLAVLEKRATNELLITRTFRVNTNFVQGVQGLITNKNLSQHEVLRAFFYAVGVAIEPPKSVFFNDRAGVLMVHVTEEDVVVIRAAIEMYNPRPPDVVEAH